MCLEQVVLVLIDASTFYAETPSNHKLFSVCFCLLKRIFCLPACSVDLLRVADSLSVLWGINFDPRYSLKFITMPPFAIVNNRNSRQENDRGVARIFERGGGGVTEATHQIVMSTSTSILTKDKSR